ncbi:hypothetical protein BC833DRAFT_136574 [Globomyces pollinis-pini]|nr:hypothetical protein BC833DRAFT_136574 [Globomyces pollinis-pini]
MHSIKKRPISSIHQDASKKRIIVEEITTQFNNQNSTNVVMNSVNSHESVLNQLNDEELKDVQLIQELLLNEGMDDDLDSTPDVDINYQAIQTNLEQNNLKNQLINDPSEDEFDQMDLDEETMNQMDLQASQYMGDDKIPQNIISMPIVTNQVSYQHLDRFSTQNAPLSMSSNRPLHTLPQGNVRKSHLLSKPTIQSVLGQNPNIQRLQDQLEKIQTELERTKTVNKQLENELLQRTGEVTYARNKLYQINDINVELRNNLATQKIQSQLESVDIKTQLEAEIDRLKTDLNFKFI